MTDANFSIKSPPGIIIVTRVVNDGDSAIWCRALPSVEIEVATKPTSQRKRLGKPNAQKLAGERRLSRVPVQGLGGISVI